MSTQEERLLAGRQVFAKVLAEEIQAFSADARKELEPLIEADEGVAAMLPDGTRLGTVKRSKPTRTAVVTDPEAFFAWVEKNRPDEIERAVSTGFLAWAKESAKKHDSAPVDPVTGEIIPGIEMLTGSPSYLPQPDPAMADVVRARFAELIGSGLLQLPEAS